MSRGSSLVLREVRLAIKHTLAAQEKVARGCATMTVARSASKHLAAAAANLSAAELELEFGDKVGEIT